MALKASEESLYKRTATTLITDVCGTDGATPLCKPGSKAAAMKTTQDSAVATLLAAQLAYEDARADWAVAYDKSQRFAQLRDAAEADMLARGATYTATAARDAAVPAATDAASAGYEAHAIKAVANAQMHCDSQDVLIAAAQMEGTRLHSNWVIASHISNKAIDQFRTLKGTLDAAKDLKVATAGQEVLATTAHTQAQAKLKVYQDQYKDALSLKKACDADVTLYKGRVADATAKTAACTAKVAMALANCKGVMYKVAQETYKTWDAQKTRDLEVAANVQKEYAADANAPTGGLAGTRCEYPKLTDDGTQGPRPTCNEELCCGAANKYMRDGTRLTVETCQPMEGTHTYKFFPKLRSGALVKPTPELWRFYCIEGAQKLAATLAAGLGAAYFMA